MSEWISAQEVRARLGQKILLAGLSEAGKTAVKRLFFLKQRPEDVDSLAATLNYERMTITINNIPLTIYDLGGQRIFVKRFLSSFSPFVFSQVRAFLFLIDVSNKEKRNNSIDYFCNCVQKLEQFSPDADFYIFLHKNDLLVGQPNYESIHAGIKEQIQLESPKRVSFFRTTIYSPDTVTQGFGRIIELSMPDLARSDLVDKQTIGEIEEFATKQMTVVDRATPVGKKPSPVKAIEERSGAELEILNQLKRISGSDSTTASTAKDMTQNEEEILSKLSNLSQGAPVENSGSSGLNDMDESEALRQLTSLMKEGLTTENETVEKQPKATTEPKIEGEIQPTVTIKEEPQISLRTKYLMDFYRIEQQSAQKLVDEGYDDVFEVAVTSGINIDIVSDVIFKHLPFLREKGINVDKLDRDRLLEVFFAHLTGMLSEKEILKGLILAAEKAEMTVEEIVNKLIKKSVEEKVEPIKPIFPSKPVIKEEEPVKISSDDDGTVHLPNTQNITFKATQADSNCKLSFFQQGFKIIETLVSPKINVEQIMYLLKYELTLPFDSDGELTFASRIIHQVIQQLNREKQPSQPIVDKAPSFKPTEGFHDDDKFEDDYFGSIDK